MTSYDFDTIPEQMRNAKRWLVWRLEKNPDPTKKPRKVPYYANGGHRSGELDSPADRARFANFEDALSAFRTGSYTGLGFALGPDGTGSVWQGIDLDDIPSRPALEFLADDLPGYVEGSPSGNGKHAIGYGRPFASLGSNATGIEAYARGRFFTVTGEGSGIHPPECLADFVEQRLKPMHSPPEKLAGENVAFESLLPPQTIKDLRSALLYLRADDRELWVRMGHALKTIGAQGRGLFMEWSATSEKFDPADTAKTWDSFTPTRTGYPAVIAEAQRVGWVNPASNSPPPEPIAAPPLYDLLVDLTLPLPEYEAVPHYVDRWLPAGEVTLLAGHGGGGKSFVSLVLSVYIALGMSIGLTPTKRANVLFFSAEDNRRALTNRLRKICQALGVNPADLAGKLHLLDMTDLDPALYRPRRVSLAGEQVTHYDTALIAPLKAMVDQLDIGVTIVDNSSDTFDAEEIVRADVRRFVRGLRQHLASNGRAVLLLAHINKASAIGGKSAGNEDYSGSTAWHNSVRSRLSLIPDGDNTLKVEHLKANHGPKAEPMRWEWIDGTPMPAGSVQNVGAEAAANIAREAERQRDAIDKVALVTVVQDFDRRGELVTTSVHGAFTVFKLMKLHPAFPKGIGSDKLTRLLRELENEGRIYRRTVRTPNRKYKEVFTCTRGSAPNAKNDHFMDEVDPDGVRQ